MKKYDEILDAEIKKCYEVANLAHSKGYDPDEKVDIPLAKNMAERVEGLISVVAPQIKGSGIVERIIELEKEHGNLDWRVALTIALEVAEQKFCKFDSKTEAMEVGIRVGLAYITVGVVVSPLEGFVKLQLNKRRDDGKEYFCLFYSGPIRSAGGTAAAVSVIIADYIRKKMGYSTYDPELKEIKRAYVELIAYHERVTNLQYLPSEKEVEFMASNLPVQINGDPSEEFEVGNYKDLPRIETNRIRNGFCLVIAECLCSKAKKLLNQFKKWGKEFEMNDWEFLKEFLKIQKEFKSMKTKEESEGVGKDWTYIKDIVAGRPVITFPLADGGLRLRYGRCRVSGLSSDSIHPATMAVLNDYIAIGTQLKTERPGKSTTISACDHLEGPIVKLKNGDVVFLESAEKAKQVKNEIEEILFLGDILINYGDFLNRGHKLLRPGFCEEWWILYLEEYIKKNERESLDKELGKEKLDSLLSFPIKTKLTAKEAIKISEKTKIPLHPRYTYHWNSLSPKQFKDLILWTKEWKTKTKKGSISSLLIPNKSGDLKRIIELLGIPHSVINGGLVLEEDEAEALLFQFGSENKKLDFENLVENPLESINKLCSVVVKDKSGYFIGARMGRPEKAKIRKLKGSPNGLFPVGEEGGRLRSFQSAIEKGKITSTFPIMFCKGCSNNTIFSVCELCDKKTTQLYYCEACISVSEKKCKIHENAVPYKNQEIDINKYLNAAKKILKTNNLPELIKGVRGVSNTGHIPEHIIKPILRAKYNLTSNKDGTIRYDMTEMVLTHFKPKEIGVPIKKLHELGYIKDVYGEELVKEDQILELKPQDLVLPACVEADQEGADEILFRIGNFIDELLEKLYGVKSYYNLKSKEDLIGHLVVGLSPHTSAGIVARIIGFSKTQGFLAHPLMHSIMRRDADGDEAGIMLLMDTLLNFSRKFLPKTRGATQDAPLLLTSKIVPTEVDDMVFDMDIVWKYPLEFYEAAESFKYPSEIKIKKFEDTLNSQKEEVLGFTHDTEDLNEGVRVSAYKSIPTMQEKVFGQMDLANKIRAVSENDVAKLVVERHFLRDIKGNLRQFSQQQFRCVACNEKFRRIPLSGKCYKCKGKIIFTVSEGTIIKYLEPSIQIAKKYKLSPYLNQVLDVLQEMIESIFGKEAEKQEELDKWF